MFKLTQALHEQSNISFYFPKTQQGMGLGLNAGIGNLGVSLSQVLFLNLMDMIEFEWQLNFLPFSLSGVLSAHDDIRSLRLD